MNRNGTCKHHMIFKNDVKKLLVYSGTAMVSELLLEWKQFFDCLLKTQNALNFVNFSSSLLKKKWLFTSCNFRFIKNKIIEKVLLRIKWTYFWLSAKTQSMQTRELKSLFFTNSSKLRRLRTFFLKCSSMFMIFHYLCSIKNN